MTAGISAGVSTKAVSTAMPGIFITLQEITFQEPHHLFCGECFV